MASIAEVKNHLTGLGGAASVDDVANLYQLLERASNTMLAKIDPIETERIAALSSLVYDDVYDYALPSDYKKIIDLYPQVDRGSWDRAARKYAEPFDAQKLIKEKQITIESSEGTKFIRINWRTRSPKILNSMNSLTANGTWSAVGSATGLKAQTLFKVSGNASIEFDLAATGDGIQNTTMSALDLTDEDEIADVFVSVYLPSAPTSITAIWGNDLTTNFWTGVAQTAQADATAFKVGWNLIKFPWSTATETGTVAPATIDSFRLTIANSAALTNVRVDNIIFAVGKNFDIKYYSKYLFKNSGGTWITRTTSDSDTVVLDSDGINIFLYESLVEMAHQAEGKDSQFDLNYASKKLNGDPSSPDVAERIGLYGKYRGEHPSYAKKAITSYSSGPRFTRLLRR